MRRIRNSGGYRKLASFQTATLIYDATYWFCKRFVDTRSRTGDQMLQAARSGRQNIAEGSRAAATTSQTELRLMNVARASLEELLLDYEDFLRHRRLALWPPKSPQAAEVRELAWRRDSDAADTTDPSERLALTELDDYQRWELYAKWLEHAEPEQFANAVICLIHQANYLLDKQISALEDEFVEGGGYSERLAAARFARRREQAELRSELRDAGTPKRDSASEKQVQIPNCPSCGGAMVIRTAKQGRNAGSPFWGCASYPDCKGILQV